MIERYVRLGLSSIILFKEMQSGPLGELEALSKASRLKNYEVIETFLSDDEALRKEEIRMLWGEGKSISYNARAIYQVPGKYNINSLDDVEFQNGVDHMKRQLDICAEAKSEKFLITSGPDYLPERREDVKRRFAEHLSIIAPYAEKLGITICIEPTERNRFKHLLLGPTKECVSFVDDFQKEYGYRNVCLMIDTAHCPLLEEDPLEAVRLASAQRLGYIHVGNAVFDEESEYYGHTHPPVGVHGGVYGLKELEALLRTLLEIGYLKTSPSYEDRPNLSYEMACYSGVSPETSAIFAYEMADIAFERALYGH
ncbi:MAG: sugar phosphate isomerase/epimerase [Spirochaetales bacterium]|nr:sugar phosphate isomerase/epimerase [Spirochaetales bacterium]